MDGRQTTSGRKGFGKINFSKKIKRAGICRLFFLDFKAGVYYKKNVFGCVAQWLEHYLHIVGVAGSNPTERAIFRKDILMSSQEDFSVKNSVESTNKDSLLSELKSKKEQKTVFILKKKESYFDVFLRLTQHRKEK